MTSRERLLAVLRGEIPDRVPISTYELNGYGTGNFENNQPSYKPLMDFIRQHTDCLYMTYAGVPNVREGKRHAGRALGRGRPAHDALHHARRRAHADHGAEP